MGKGTSKFEFLLPSMFVVSGLALIAKDEM
jgi:hypothetical protein